MQVVPRDRFKRTAFIVFLIVFVASCIRPPYVEFLLMQHVPTVLAGGLLGYLSNKIVISRASFTSITLFLILHTVGARYLYSYTPYDEWTQRLFGFTISDAFGFERNHYDRLVHFCFGLLLVIPVQEFEMRCFKLSSALAGLLAVECILATSAGYELLEWFVAIVFTPEWADQFLGQQGDQFDAQKDMALAFSGAVISMCSVALCRRGNPEHD